MSVFNVNLGEDQKINLILGQQGENAVTSVVFDFSAWSTEFGSGTLSLSVQRPGDALPYAVVMTVSGTDATWEITDLDTAYKGTGEIQLKYTVGTKVKKSVVHKFTVYRSLGENGEYPSPGQTWQEEIEADIADVKADLNDITSTTRNLWIYGNQSFIGSKTIELSTPLTAGMYAISAIITSTDTDVNVCRIAFQKANGDNIATVDLGRNIRVGTAVNLSSDCYKIQLRAATNSSSMAGDTATWANIQIEVGSVVTPYIPPYTADDEIARNRIKSLDTVYISPTGSDTNDGSADNPFATIQKAINEGYKNICVEAGEYIQAVNASNIDGINIYANNNDIYSSSKRPRPVFTNGKKFSDFSTDANGYKYFGLSDIPNQYTAVFINHTLPPETTGTRPTYNAGLWVNHNNKYDDFTVKPVLTYAELTENNTFFFDGTNVYFNVSDTINGVTVVYNTAKCFDFSNCNNLSIDGIKVLYSITTNITIAKCNNVVVKNCEIGYTMSSDNVSASYSNVQFINCESYKARNDGFNSHYYGVSIFDDCRGIYNYDDGESSHEYCEIIVHGGEYAFNGKGGHSPVNGCKFKCDGTYAHDNGYGFYLSAGNDFELSDIIISNSIAVDNNTYDLINVKYTTKLWNTVLGTSSVVSGTVTDLSN